MPGMNDSEWAEASYPVTTGLAMILQTKGVTARKKIMYTKGIVSVLGEERSANIFGFLTTSTEKNRWSGGSIKQEVQA